MSIEVSTGTVIQMKTFEAPHDATGQFMMPFGIGFKAIVGTTNHFYVPLYVSEFTEDVINSDFDHGV